MKSIEAYTEIRQWPEFLGAQRVHVVRATFTAGAEMRVSDVLARNSPEAAFGQAKAHLLHELHSEIYGDLILELKGLREKLFLVDDCSVLPAIDRLSGLIDRLQRGGTA